jgi:hypothetical protein
MDCERQAAEQCRVDRGRSDRGLLCRPGFGEGFVMANVDDLLGRIKKPLATMKVRDYTTYVRAQLSGPEWSCEDLRRLCRHYVCPVDQLDRRIARDRLGKG